MRITSRQRALEAQTGQPVADILRAALRRGRSVSRAAQELGISRFTLRAWAAAHGIDTEATVLEAKLAARKVA